MRNDIGYLLFFHKAELPHRFPHALRFRNNNFFSIDINKPIKVSNKKMQRNAINACRNGMCKRALTKHLNKVCNAKVIITFESLLSRVKMLSGSLAETGFNFNMHCNGILLKKIESCSPSNSICTTLKTHLIILLKGINPAFG